MRSLTCIRHGGRLFIAAASMLAVATSARAADLPLPPPVAAPFYNWSGLYLGLNAGYTSASVGESVTGAAVDSAGASLAGGIGGAQFGFNYQLGRVVVGFEADFDGTMATKTLTGAVLSNTARIPWVATVRGRLGYAFDRYLVYATAGGAADQLFAGNINVAGVGTSETTYTHGAWTVGGGVEVGITQYLSAKLEYLYVDTGSFDVAQISAGAGAPVAAVAGRIQESMVRAGLNLRLPAEP
jgi:outer membrane immunogenic protein